MVIRKLAIPRRTFLRGVGATVALPLLDAMTPAFTAVAKTAANTKVRLGFVYIPNGVIQTQFFPSGTSGRLELPRSLGDLAPFKDQITLISGMAHMQAYAQNDGDGDHARAAAAWLSGTHGKRTEGADVQAGTTVDQLAAQQLGADTALPSLELALEQNDKMVGNCESGYSCTYQNTMSWRTPTSPNPPEVHPRVVFERLFGDGASSSERLAQARTTRSILDSITDDMKRLRNSLGLSDRQVIDEYFDGVRYVEQRIQKIEAQSFDSSFALPERPVDIPQTFEDHAKLMFDLNALAYQADLTRVVTFQLGRELSPRTYPEIGVPQNHHSISHHRGNPETMNQVAKINGLHARMFAYFLDRLRSTLDGDSTLLDNAIILYGGGIGDGNLHSHTNLPTLVAGGAGGRLTGGRFLKYPDPTPMANLLLAIALKAGVRLEQVGDSTGPLTGV